jgi:hypothetical protein
MHSISYSSTTGRRSVFPCYIDSLADTVSRAVTKVAQHAGGPVIPGDTVPQGSRGHLVRDSSDERLNFSAVVE